MDKYFEDFSKGSLRLRTEAKLAGTDVPLNLRAIDNALTGEGVAKKSKLGNYASQAKAASQAIDDAAQFAKKLEALQSKITGSELGVDADFAKNVNLLAEALARGKISFEDYSKLAGLYAGQQKVSKDAIKEQEEAQKALNQINEAAMQIESKLIASAGDALESTLKSNDALREEIATIGLSERKINDRTIALLESKLAAYELVAAVQAMSDADRASAEATRMQIEALKARSGLIDSKEIAVAAKDGREAFDRQWQDVGRDLTDWIMVGMKNTKQLLKKLFADLVLRPIISPIANSISGGLSSLFGGGGGGGGGGLLGGLGSLFGAGGASASDGGGGGGLLSAGASLFPSFLGGSGLATAGGVFSSVLAGTGSVLQGLTAGLSSLTGGASAFLGVLGPIGLGVAALAAAWKPLFGRKLKDTGLDVSLNSSGVGGSQYEFYKGGLFRSDKTVNKPLDDELAKALDKTRASIFDGVRALASALDADASKLDSVTASFKFSTKGLSEEQIKQRIADEFDKLTSAAVKAIDFSGASQKFNETVQGFTGKGEELIKFVKDYVAVVTLVKAAQESAKLAAAGYADELSELEAQRANGVLASLRAQQSGVSKLLGTAAETDGMMGSLLQGMTSLRSAAIAFADQVAQVREGVAQGFGSTIRELQLSIMSDKEKFSFLQKETDGLALRALSSTDPLQIAKLTDEILENVNSASSLVPQDQRAEWVAAQVARLEELQAQLDGRLVEVGKTEAERVSAQIAEIGKKLDEVAAAMLAVAEKNQQTANTESNTADKNLAAANTPLSLNVSISAPTGYSARVEA